MKRWCSVMVVAALAVSLVGCAKESESSTESKTSDTPAVEETESTAESSAVEAPVTETKTASIGDATFSFTNEKAYYDLTYMYPNEFELEVKEDDSEHVRDILRYHVDGYDPTAVGIVVSRTKEFTPEGRLADISWIDEIVTEEINGVPWAIGTQTDTSNGRLIIYARAAGDYTYTFSFSTDYPADFDFTDFARAFAETVH